MAHQDIHEVLTDQRRSPGRDLEIMTETGPYEAITDSSGDINDRVMRINLARTQLIHAPAGTLIRVSTTDIELKVYIFQQTLDIDSFSVIPIDGGTPEKILYKNLKSLSKYEEHKVF